MSQNILLPTLTALKKLEHLDLARNAIRGDGGLFRTLGKELPELTSLAISYSWDRRQSALTDISEAMPQLQQLDLKEGSGLSPAAVVQHITVPCQKLALGAGAEWEQQQLLGWLVMYGHHLEELVVVGLNSCFPSAVTSVLQSLALQQVPSAAAATPATAAALSSSTSSSTSSSSSSSSSFSSSSSSAAAAAAAAGLYAHPAPAAAGVSRSAQVQLLRPLMQLRELEVRCHDDYLCWKKCNPFAQLTVLTGLTKLGVRMPRAGQEILRTIAEIKGLRELDFTGSRHWDNGEEEEGRRHAVRGVNYLTGLTGLTKLVFPGAWVTKRRREGERERSTRGDRVLFSSVGLWEGFLGVKITRIPYHGGGRSGG